MTKLDPSKAVTSRDLEAVPDFMYESARASDVAKLTPQLLEPELWLRRLLPNHHAASSDRRVRHVALKLKMN